MKEDDRRREGKDESLTSSWWEAVDSFVGDLHLSDERPYQTNKKTGVS